MYKTFAPSFQVASLVCTASSGHTKSGVAQPPNEPNSMKKPLKWWTSLMILTCQGLENTVSWKRPRSRRVRRRCSGSSLLLITSPIPSRSLIRRSCTVLRRVLLSLSTSRRMCCKQNLLARRLKLISSKDYRAENQEASLTLSRGRNSRRWRPATRNSRSHPQRDR